MRLTAKVLALLAMIFLVQVGIDVARAASEYGSTFETGNQFTTSDAAVAAAVEARIARSNPATRWLAGRVLGFRSMPG